MDAARIVLLAALVAAIAWLAVTAADAQHDRDEERRKREHACLELDRVGADSDSGADVEACTF